MVKLSICILFFAVLFGGAGTWLYTFGQEIKPSGAPFDVPLINLVHFGDVLDVDVAGGFEFDWRGTITPEGFLDGFENFEEPIFALCRSEKEIGEAVAMSLSNILREPKVTVKIIDRSGRPEARVLGAVRTPMRFSVRRLAYLQEVLIATGGITDEASGDITIHRSSFGACSVRALDASMISDVKYNRSVSLVIKITELLSGTPDSNPPIFSGDIITVEQALPVYLIGAIENPKPIHSRAKMTLSRAIASAGGLAKNADPTEIVIFRKVDGRSTLIEADLEKIRLDESSDIELQPFDIIEVASRGAAKRKYPPVAEIEERHNSNLAKMPLKILE